METVDIVDYAMPLMNIERMAREAYELCLNHDYAAASEVALRLGVEARILTAVLAIMQNKETMR